MAPLLSPGNSRRPLTISAAPCGQIWCSGSAEVLLLLQRGYVDVGFMGGAQIDQYGNLNSSFIGDPAKPKTGCRHRWRQRYFKPHPNDRCHDAKRRFVEKVDFITSPGWLNGGPRGPTADCRLAACIASTDLACLVLMRPPGGSPLRSIGVPPEQVQDNTGFKLDFDNDVGVTGPPTAQELSALRTLDPERLYIG